MPKKSKFLIVPYTILYSGASFINNAACNTENAVEIKPPIHMVVTRVTFQVQGIAGGNTMGVLISDHASNTSQDGFLLTTIIDPATLGGFAYNYFTFENFGDESISQSFYLTNVAQAIEPAYVTVIFEGYINE